MQIKPNIILRIITLFTAALILQACGNKVDCNSSRAKDDALKIIQQNLNNAVWYKDITKALSGTPELTNIKTDARNDQTNQCQCSAKYVVTYNDKQRELDFNYSLAYLQDKKETEVRVNVDAVKAAFIKIVMRESPKKTPEELAVIEAKRITDEQEQLKRDAFLAERSRNEADQGARCVAAISSMPRNDELAMIRYRKYGMNNLNPKNLSTIQDLESKLAQKLAEVARGPAVIGQSISHNFEYVESKYRTHWLAKTFKEVFSGYISLVCSEENLSNANFGKDKIRLKEQLRIAEELAQFPEPRDYSAESESWMESTPNTNSISVEQLLSALRTKANSER